MMKEKKYKGEIKETPRFKIYLNVNHLKEGKYRLDIISNNKIIQTTKFKK